MLIISNILLTLFILSAILLVLLVIIQDDQGESIGGLFAGSSSPFRSRSGNALQHITTVVAIFFLVSAMGYALMIKPQDPLGNLGISPDGSLLESILEGGENTPAEPKLDGEDLGFNLPNSTPNGGFGLTPSSNSDGASGQS